MYLMPISLRKCPPMRAAEPRGGLFLRQIKFGGPYRTRTGHLLIANEALYQMS